jgi:hypothetical protein
MFLSLTLYIVALQANTATQFNRDHARIEPGKEDFERAPDVPDGLGPRINLDGCGGCHLATPGRISLPNEPSSSRTPLPGT